MYLQTATTIYEVVDFGVKPAIELMNIAEDLTEDGEYDRAEMLRIEVKGRLLRIREALERIEKEEYGRVSHCPVK